MYKQLLSFIILSLFFTMFGVSCDKSNDVVSSKASAVNGKDQYGDVAGKGVIVADKPRVAVTDKAALLVQDPDWKLIASESLAAWTSL